MRAKLKQFGVRLFCTHKSNKMQEFPIESYEQGQRLDRFLKKSPIGWVSAQIRLRKKQIFVSKPDGTLISNRSYRLQKGDKLLVSHDLLDKFMQKDKPSQIAQETGRKVLQDLMIYENQNIAVLNKPAGFTVQGGTQMQKNLFSLMAARYKKENIHVTHRLDKVTSGIVLMAKNKQTAQCIQMAMEDRKSLSKYYLAMCEGRAQIKKQQYIRCNIEWSSNNKARLSRQTVQASKDCITFYVPLRCEQISEQMYRSVLGIKLLTGRKHQIRCHLGSYLNSPIIKDSKYLYPSTQKEPTSIFLHSFGLKIKNQQVIERVFSKSRETINKQVGTTIKGKEEIEFYSQLPSHWNSYANMLSRLPKLPVLGRGIERLEKQSENMRPKQRNIEIIE